MGRKFVDQVKVDAITELMAIHLELMYFHHVIASSRVQFLVTIHNHHRPSSILAGLGWAPNQHLTKKSILF